ncbi:chromosome segregation protein Csm1/Pcs1-domain-containing protein [Echria macrotheca]|uniref:Chromosome segregation protein Csm1/Pcs1-domain-containing protein n=1 Tax=Echria macrotheca TaxID=438768 RepID=A0AAJ0BCW5_9PEZI|nr:chromosome segregation protein Csm1/Pcs1-domain-containing protein [Echria macrotheca]
MLRAKVAPRGGNLLGFVDSDSEDGLGGTTFSSVAKKTKPTVKKQPLSAAMAPATKAGRGRAAANKVTKPAPASKTTAATRRNNERIAAAAEAAMEDDESRDALVEKSTNAQPKATGRGRKKAAAVEKEDDDIEMEDVAEEPAKPKATRGRPKKAAGGSEATEAVQTARAPMGRKPATKRGQVVAAAAVDESEIPETQPQVYQSEMDEDEPVGDLPTRQTDIVEPSRIEMSSPLKRPQYSSSSEGGGEPALRRRLGEMTQKYETLEQKYRDLRDVAVREAERNFDRLKKQSEERAKAAEQLIASLKSELAAKKEEAKEVVHLKKQLEQTESKSEDLEARVTALTTSLSDSKTEIKALNMKLSAARSVEAPTKVPGSVVKGGGATKGLLGADAQPNNVSALVTYRLKENLYSDLTGLIVRGAKRENGEDVYDCLQTGRNGTLHFKLTVPSDASAENFDDAQTFYTPHLEPKRDRDLISILPDFLVEPIGFARRDTSKFYSRVLKALNDPIVFDDDDE